MIKRLTTPWLLLVLALLSACGSEGGKALSAKGNSPEHAAKSFFYAIYIDKSLDEIQKYSTPKMKRLIKGYGSVNGVARNMLNMQFDTVEIEVDKGRNLRETYGEKANITLIFNGRLHGNKVSDLRTVNMVKLRGTWLVAKVKDDPFAR